MAVRIGWIEFRNMCALHELMAPVMEPHAREHGGFDSVEFTLVRRDQAVWKISKGKIFGLF